MQTMVVETDRHLIGQRATSFPEGVAQAWKALHEKLDTVNGRMFYGLSQGSENGSVVYHACVQETVAGEAERLGLVRFILPKGEYVGEMITDFRKRTAQIGETFQALLANVAYDPEGFCVEQYGNENDVFCMIRKNDIRRTQE